MKKLRLRKKKNLETHLQLVFIADAWIITQDSLSHIPIVSSQTNVWWMLGTILTEAANPIGSVVILTISQPATPLKTPAHRFNLRPINMVLMRTPLGRYKLVVCVPSKSMPEKDSPVSYSLRPVILELNQSLTKNQRLVMLSHSMTTLSMKLSSITELRVVHSPFWSLSQVLSIHSQHLPQRLDFTPLPPIWCE